MWMICGIPHICEDVLFNANVEHMKQVNTVIKRICGTCNDEINDNIETFYSKYTEFHYKNGPFYFNDFI